MCDCDKLQGEKDLRARAFEFLARGEVDVVWKIFNKLRTLPQEEWGTTIVKEAAKTAYEMAQWENSS